MPNANLSAFLYALLFALLAVAALLLFFISPPVAAAIVILLVLLGLQRRRRRWLASAPPPHKQSGVRVYGKRSWADEQNRLHYLVEFAHPEWGEQTLTYEVPELAYNALQAGDMGLLTIQTQFWGQSTEEAAFVSFEKEESVARKEESC